MCVFTYGYDEKYTFCKKLTLDDGGVCARKCNFDILCVNGCVWDRRMYVSVCVPVPACKQERVYVGGGVLANGISNAK